VSAEGKGALLMRIIAGASGVMMTIEYKGVLCLWALDNILGLSRYCLATWLTISSPETGLCCLCIIPQGPGHSPVLSHWYGRCPAQAVSDHALWSQNHSQCW
jgi:hypothetical protein